MTSGRPAFALGFAIDDTPLPESGEHEFHDAWILAQILGRTNPRTFEQPGRKEADGHRGRGARRPGH